MKKHPLAIRWLHWVNFPLLTLMIWSGLLIYWANRAYRIGWGEVTLFEFFPAWFNQALNLPQRLAEGMALHFFFMWLFAINGVVYFLYLLISGEWRVLAPEPASIKQAWLVVLHDLHLRKELPPQGKYNAAQRIVYSLVVLMGGASLVTGLAIYKPAQLAWLATALGGYQAARFQHFWLMIFFVLFFAMHVAQVIIAGWSNFRSMVTGHEAGQTVRDRRAFLVFGGSALTALGGYLWLEKQPDDAGAKWPYRRALEFNEKVASAYFDPKRQAREFPLSAVEPEPRVNGDIGMGGEWKLTVGGRQISLEDVKSLPKVEQITELNCIEGWTNVVRWGGVRFSDFTQKFAPEMANARFVGMRTPDEEYYVGLDMASALHPQTLLAFEQNGEPLTQGHGAPLRLVIPVKYGIKNIKWIGAIEYSDQRPDDYWAEEGYDWYAGL